MGITELNKILGTDLGVHDIEDVYDLCKNRDGETYYLRVKAKCSPLVIALEDSNKYAGDDRLLVSGNWEFGGAESEATWRAQVPRTFGTPPSNALSFVGFRIIT